MSSAWIVICALRKRQVITKLQEIEHRGESSAQVEFFEVVTQKSYFHRVLGSNYDHLGTDIVQFPECKPVLPESLYLYIPVK